MAGWQEIEELKRLVLSLGLPRNDFALFGVTCPYCGKSDRIHKLDPPPEVSDAPPEYGKLWDKYTAKGELVVCTFCRHLLLYKDEQNRVSPVTDG